MTFDLFYNVLFYYFQYLFGLYGLCDVTFDIYGPENPVAMACLAFYTTVSLWNGWKWLRRLRKNYKNSENKQEVKIIDVIEVAIHM